MPLSALFREMIAPRMTLCQGVALVQVALALGSLALGQPALAGAFAVFAAAQIITLAVQRCAWAGEACERTPLVDAAARLPNARR